ncbi:MAG: hypothetical protein IPP40_16995 [bacterium]|nr:hypothetical protein [bacterium]
MPEFPDKWNIYLDPVWMDIDLIDIADTVGNILDAAIENAVDNLLGWLPGWAKDAIEWILGSIWISFARRLTLWMTLTNGCQTCWV